MSTMTAPFPINTSGCEEKIEQYPDGFDKSDTYRSAISKSYELTCWEKWSD